MGLTGAFGLWSLAKVEQGQASMPMCLNTQLCHAAHATSLAGHSLDLQRPWRGAGLELQDGHEPLRPRVGGELQAGLWEEQQVNDIETRGLEVQ